MQVQNFDIIIAVYQSYRFKPFSVCNFVHDETIFDAFLSINKPQKPWMKSKFVMDKSLILNGTLRVREITAKKKETSCILF